MAKALVLLKFTDQGVRAMKQSPSRAKAFAAEAAHRGVKVEQQFWTMGPHDGAIVLSAPSETELLGCVASLAIKGNVTTLTLPGLDEAEFARILDRA